MIVCDSRVVIRSTFMYLFFGRGSRGVFSRVCCIVLRHVFLVLAENSYRKPVKTTKCASAFNLGSCVGLKYVDDLAKGIVFNVANFFIRVSPTDLFLPVLPSFLLILKISVIATARVPNSKTLYSGQCSRTNSGTRGNF